jgi:hypothetical protein
MRWMGLRNGHQLNVSASPAGCAARSFDCCLKLFKIFGDRHHGSSV